MKQTTAAGIGGAFVMLLLAVIMEGGNPMAFINIPAFLIVVGGTVLRAARVHEHGGRDAPCRSSRSSRSRAARRRRPGGGAGRWSASPRRRAGRGCSRSRRSSRRSTTSTRRRASSWSWTAPTRRSSGRSSSPRSTAWASATRRTPSCSRRRRLRADARHPRHRPVARARAREPLEPGRARPLDRRRVHRDALRRRRANIIFLPIGNKLKGMSEVEVNYRDDAARGRPRDPGRRQPAHARRAARDVPRSRRARAAPPSDGAEADAAAPSRRCRRPA